MICPECGNRLNEQADNCPICGLPAGAPAPSAAEAKKIISPSRINGSSAAPMEQQSAHTDKRHFSKPAIILVCVFADIAISGAVVYGFFTQKTASGDPRTTATAGIKTTASPVYSVPKGIYMSEHGEYMEFSQEYSPYISVRVRSAYGGSIINLTCIAEGTENENVVSLISSDQRTGIYNIKKGTVTFISLDTQDTTEFYYIDTLSVKAEQLPGQWKIGFDGWYGYDNGSMVFYENGIGYSLYYWENEYGESEEVFYNFQYIYDPYTALLYIYGNEDMEETIFFLEKSIRGRIRMYESYGEDNSGWDDYIFYSSNGYAFYSNYSTLLVPVS